MIAANNCPSDEEPDDGKRAGQNDMTRAENGGEYVGPERSEIAGQRDVAIMARAIREEWPMTAEQKRCVVERLMEVVQKSNKARDVTRAAVALGMLDKANIAASGASKHNHLHLHGPQQIEVVHVDDWYGSKAANSAAADAASSRRIDGG